MKLTTKSFYNKATVFAASLTAALLFAASPLLADYHEPEFTVLEKNGPIEIREYKAFTVAEVTLDGDFDEVGNQAHRLLFDYISGKNAKNESVEMAIPVNQSAADKSKKAGEKIEMAVPVNQSADASGQYRVSFVLPARFTAENAPRPLDDRVVIRTIAAKKAAVIRYSGTWSNANYVENRGKLFDFLNAGKLQAHGEPVWARYNPPWTPWFLRRNEIIVEVKSKL